MLGHITQSNQFQFNETLKVLTEMADSPPVEMSDHFHYGALNTELQFTENLVKSTRCAKFKLIHIQSIMIFIFYAIFEGLGSIQKK